jgi:hypothetical protein
MQVVAPAHATTWLFVLCKDMNKSAGSCNCAVGNFDILVTMWPIVQILVFPEIKAGRIKVVGIQTRYELGGPGIELRCR